MSPLLLLSIWVIAAGSAVTTGANGEVVVIVIKKIDGKNTSEVILPYVTDPELSEEHDIVTETADRDERYGEEKRFGLLDGQAEEEARIFAEDPDVGTGRLAEPAGVHWSRRSDLEQLKRYVAEGLDSLGALENEDERKARVLALN